MDSDTKTEKPSLKYKRVLLKLSGEALLGESGFGIAPDVLLRIATEIKAVWEEGLEIAVVVGGGNIFRGVSDSAKGMDRTTADQIGMLATVINGMALQGAFESLEVPTRVLSAIKMQELCEPYIRRRSERHLEKGRVVIFAAGTGNPYFTTDTAAALRAMEIGADIILKATKVDGVYDVDPVTNSGAIRYDQIDYLDVLRKKIRVMDTTAIGLCMDNNMPIMVFDMTKTGNISRAIRGETIGTLVR